MNVRLRFNTDFNAAVWYQDQFMINHFSINLQLITQSQDPEDHPVCMGRIQTVIDQLEHSVLINQANTNKSKELIDCGLRVVSFPQEPIDQIVGIVLFEKINSVLDGRMRATDLDICSDLGDNIWFMHSDNEALSMVPSNGWWADSNPVCTSSQITPHEKKVVKLQKNLTWKSLDLEWPVTTTPSETVIINIKDDK